jgi:hypothetical protein
METGQYPLSYGTDHETGTFRERAVDYDVRSGVTSVRERSAP